MYRYMGQAFAEKLGELAGLAGEDREVVAYGLEYLLSLAIGLALTLLAGRIAGLFLETLAVLCCWWLLRIFAGGSHCSARWRCTVATFAGMLSVALAAKLAHALAPAYAWVACCSLWTLLAVWLWAPNNSARTIDDPQKRRQMRRRALGITAAAGIILLYLTLGLNSTELMERVTVAGATGFAAGALMLSPAGFRLADWCDKTLAFMQQIILRGR